MPNFREIHRTYCLFVVSLGFVLFIQGAVPFLSMPTLGQAIWTTGFSQSFANFSIPTIYATNFGNPEPAPISFGLAGAYLAALFIRLGLHAADAYSLMLAVWLSIAFIGTWKASRAFGLPSVFCALISILWLSLPMIWWHGRYCMLSIGISLLPLYMFMALRLFMLSSDNLKKNISIAGVYLLMTIVAVFMDGYTFMMFAVGSSILGVYSFWRFDENRKEIVRFALPIHILSFGLACFLYILYIGITLFKASSLNFFRGWGADLIFFAVPTQGVHWLWDFLGASLPRTEHEQFGDGSVWSTTFALPIIILGILAWWRTQRKSKLATGFLIVALFGFYMGMGPSLKINSLKPEGFSGRGMAEEYAVMPLGSSWLSAYIPGFRDMRASYRWCAMGFLGLWFLILLYFSLEQKRWIKWVGVILTAFVILSNLPHMKDNFSKFSNNRDAFFSIENSIVGDLAIDVNRGEKVAFLPYRNDFLVNYLTARTGIFSYNIGGDKNLIMAKKHWPKTMSLFKMGQFGQDFTENVMNLLIQKEADVVVLPYLDLLWAAHSWPSSLQFKEKVGSVVEKLRRRNLVEVHERAFYAVVRLK